MQKTISTTDLNEWTGHFRDNPKLPFVTNSALISLEDLESFIAEIKKQKGDSVRLYFLRFRKDHPPTAAVFAHGKLKEGCKWQESAEGFTQAGIAMVPAKNFRHDGEFVYFADDIITGGQLLALLPGTVGKGTALNPPPTVNATLSGTGK